MGHKCNPEPERTAETVEGLSPWTALSIGRGWAGAYLGQADRSPGLGPGVLDQEPLVKG